MFNGYESASVNPTHRSTTETNSMNHTENAQLRPTPKITTIGTIALRSGSTRLVIALLQTGDVLKLKILEVEPELTSLGCTLDEATKLLDDHNEVLHQLQNKQNPVEELLRQADHSISTQTSKADVYKAMAETLGNAWTDVNALLERRRQILDSNVLFQCRADECKKSMKALEMACNDTLLPIEIDAVKQFLEKIHHLRKNMLEALMGSLQEGKTLLDRLKEIATEGTLDSRPDRIKNDADCAVSLVEKWLEELHDRRRCIEISFRNRKLQLEQCLALALLATDLRDLEEILNDRRAALNSTGDHLGDSLASAKLLIHELQKLQIEAKDFQDKAIKVTKSTEKLVSTGHFAGEQATKQSYEILESAVDYVNELDQYENLLHKATAFFESAQSALTKIDQLEIQLATTDQSLHSVSLAKLHALIVNTLNDVTADPLTKGHALLEITGRGAPGAEGVRRLVEELEDRKIRLLQHCTTQEKENQQVSSCLNEFLKKYEDLSSWFKNVVESFLHGHQDMGSDLLMAKDFHELHLQLQRDLRDKSNEVSEFHSKGLSPSVVEILNDAEQKDIASKMDALYETWRLSEQILKMRIKLSSLYVDFHQVADDLEKVLDNFEDGLKDGLNYPNEQKMQELERNWNLIQSLLQQLTSNWKRFLESSENIKDGYVDIARARLCTETVVNRCKKRQSNVSMYWQNYQSCIADLNENRVERAKNLEESIKALHRASKFKDQLYPIINSQSVETSIILTDLKGLQEKTTKEVDKIITEVDSRIVSFDISDKKEKIVSEEEAKKTLIQLSEQLKSTAYQYRNLLHSLILIFERFVNVEIKTEEQKQLMNQYIAKNSSKEIVFQLERHEMQERMMQELLINVKTDVSKTVDQIGMHEPPLAAKQDIEKILKITEKVTSSWENVNKTTKDRLNKDLKLASFKEDLKKIDCEIRDLNEQLDTISGWLSESFVAAKGASEAFLQFEKTLHILEQRIEVFISKSTDQTCENLTKVQNDVGLLRQKLQNFKSHAQETRKRIDSSLNYYQLLEEAKDWFKEGSKLLIVAARRATQVKTSEDAQTILVEIERFLKPGEDLQEQRIKNVRNLSTQIFGTDRLPQFNEVVVENREMLDSFAVVSSELRNVVENLRNAESSQQNHEIERDEVDVQVNETKEEMTATIIIAPEEEHDKTDTQHLATQSMNNGFDAKVPEEKSSLIELNDLENKVVLETVTSEITEEEIRVIKKIQVEEVICTNVDTEPGEDAGEVSLPNGLPLAIPPQFTVTLHDATVPEGEKFQFECHVIGNPSPNICWFKDDISVANNPDYQTNYESGVCTLTIEEIFSEDTACFKCAASNEFGVAETCAKLSVKETLPEEQQSPPSFIKELVDCTAIEGSIHRFECTVKGNPLPTVQWYKNDTNIDNSADYTTTYNNGDAVLTIEEVSMEDQAAYTCKATNRLGQVSKSAVLSVEPINEELAVSREKPSFVSTLSDISTVSGQKVKLECEVKGIPLPFITWKHDGELISDCDESQVHIDGGKCSLTIPAVLSKNAGCYTVIANNLVGEASTVCNVSVKALPMLDKTSELDYHFSEMEPVKPSIQLPLKDQLVVEGSNVRLDCVIVGHPEPEVIWYHDEKPVKESADFQLLFQGDKCSLIINEAFLDDAGSYKVVAINSAGEISSDCKLQIKPRAPEELPGAPPKFIKLLSDLLIGEGETATFECIVTSEPKPEITWFLNNEEILEDETRTITQESNGLNTLKISPTTAKDKGNYIVKATNKFGEAKAFARLVVKVLGDFPLKEELIRKEEKQLAPIFKEKIHDQIVTEDDEVKFECVVTGKPYPKIYWLYNDKPIGKSNFLISFNGEKQTLTIPKAAVTDAGTVSCVAENGAGKVTCNATLQVGRGSTGEELNLVQVPATANEMHASSSNEKFFSTEKIPGGGGVDSQLLTTMSSSFTESSTSHTTMKQEFVSSTSSSTLGSTGHQPTSSCLKKTSQSSEYATSQNGNPPVKQSHKVEEYECIQGVPGQTRQEKTTVVITQDEEVTKKKPVRKSTVPRFVSPLTGMIVDQGSDVILAGIIDGFPQPTVSWMKNNKEIRSRESARITCEHNHVCLELKDVGVKDAGRYTCTITNEVGTASSTADLVVKKTIFPPVFGRRLQAQVVKRGERVIMEVEITGTPEPTVTWYKDDIQIHESYDVRMKQQGNCYLMLIDRAEKEHAGKYMVRATNSGGEAQSIADFAVFEPIPDTMVETHKTLVCENIKDKKVEEPDGKKGEVPSSNLTTQHITTTMIQPSVELKTPFPSHSAFSTIRTLRSETVERPGMEETRASRSEIRSSTVESHRSETKSEQKFHMKLEHQTPDLFGKPADEPVGGRTTTTEIKKEVFKDGKSFEEESKTVKQESIKEIIENENVETSTVARKDALSFFESMSKGGGDITLPKGPKEMIKLTEDEEESRGCDVKVDKLTKNYEKTTKFDNVTSTDRPGIPESRKKAVQDMFNKFEQTSSGSRGIENTLIEFPYEGYKLPRLDVKRTVLEDLTASGSPIHGTLTISKLAAQSESAEAMLKGFNLVPEPPPEIAYAPKPETPDAAKKKRPDISVKAKQLQESFDKSISPIDAPVGGVKLFPTSPAPKPEVKFAPPPALKKPCSIPPPFELDSSSMRSEKFDSTSHYTYSSESKPSADGIAMDKSWSRAGTDSRKSWPPQEITKTYSEKQEWILPEQDYKTSSHQVTQDVKVSPSGMLTKTNVESSSTLEQKAWCSKHDTKVEHTIVSPPQSPQKPDPIIYNAETIKVGHTVNTIEEKMMTEKYTSECDIKKVETVEKSVLDMSESRCKNWPESDELKAPRLVKNAEMQKPVVQLYHTEPQLVPEPAPKIMFAPGPAVQESKVEKIERTLEMALDQRPAKIPPGSVRTLPSPPKKQEPVAPMKPCPIRQPAKYTKTSMYSESEYESDFDNRCRQQSDIKDFGFRSVRAPVPIPPRPKSTEPEPLPPSHFEIPPPQLTGPSRPVVVDDQKKKKFSKYEKDVKQRYSMSYEPEPVLKPGSPPIYVQPATGKCLQQESGYMADTEEQMQKSDGFSRQEKFCKSYSSFSESSSMQNEMSQKKDYMVPTPFTQSIPRTSFQQSSYVEKQSSGPASRTKSTKEFSQMERWKSSRSEVYDSRKSVQSTPSPSKFVKSEFRESDYESDFDSRVPKVWKSHGSDSEERYFKSMKSSISGTGKPRPSSMTELSFVKPYDSSVKKDGERKKTVLLPGSPPEIAYAPPQKSYYEGRSSEPIHNANAFGTETKKTVRMDESTENTRRIFTVQQTSRVIKFRDDQNETSKQKQFYQVPTPTKFVQGNFTESEYETDVDSSRIKSRWTPADSDTEEPRYRIVQPPKPRSKPSEKKPMPIITMPSESETDTEKRFRRSQYEEQILKPGSPPQYGYIKGHDIKQDTNHLATKHMSDMTSSFKSKTEKFVQDIHSDLQKKNKPILKQSSGDVTIRNGNKSQTYREESRDVQYGTKHIDPETGLIYFKYDFGYEFGIVLPGEGKKASNSNTKLTQGHQRRASDIDVPIIHEFSTRKENGFRSTPLSAPSTLNRRNLYKPKQYGTTTKSVKWEQTSESEFSELEDGRGRKHQGYSAPPNLLIPVTSPKWDQTTSTPVSLSPSFPSLSPRPSSVCTGPPSNIESTGSPWPNDNGVHAEKEIIQPYLDVHPKKAPLFITPLRDIASINGQSARFECIVQAEPQPNIIWARNGRILENSEDCEIHYRNGVCRLVLLRTYPDDAGTYSCTATNSLGSSTTSAILAVPGNRRSLYGV